MSRFAACRQNGGRYCSFVPAASSRNDLRPCHGVHRTRKAFRSASVGDYYFQAAEQGVVVASHATIGRRDTTASMPPPSAVSRDRHLTRVVAPAAMMMCLRQTSADSTRRARRTTTQRRSMSGANLVKRQSMAALNEHSMPPPLRSLLSKAQENVLRAHSEENNRSLSQRSRERDRNRSWSLRSSMAASAADSSSVANMAPAPTPGLRLGAGPPYNRSVSISSHALSMAEAENAIVVSDDKDEGGDNLG